MAAPTFVGTYVPASNWGSTADGATRTSTSFDVVTGDILVIMGQAALSDKSFAAAGPSATGGSITWTSQINVGTSGNFNRGQAYTGIVGATATGITVSWVNDGGTGTRFWGFRITHWRGSDGIGASPASGTVAATAPSRAITTTQDDSAIMAQFGDWSAVDGAVRTWRTINSITPTAGNGFELGYFRDSSQYTVYTAIWNGVGTAGSKTTGLSGPSGQDSTQMAIEIKGSAGVAFMPRKGLIIGQSIRRASLW